MDEWYLAITRTLATSKTSFQFFHGLQFVYEQKYMMKYDLHPLKVVGYEGIFGVLTLSVLLWPMYFVKFGSNEGLLDGIALGPEYR